MPAPVKIVGGQKSQIPGVELSTDQLWGAIYETVKPLDYTGNGQVLGHYRIAKQFANTAAQTGPLFTYRWAPNGNQLMVPLRISASAVITTPFTTAQVVDIMATIARAYTAAATGGTALAPFTTGQKDRTNMGSSLISDMRYGNITAGTRTLDAAPFSTAIISSGNSALAGVLPQIDLYSLPNQMSHPIVHAANEGMEISPATALGAAGILTYYIVLEWAEVVVF